MNNTRKSNIERYSSAYTLSDMEIFIFPELFYALVLANIMSPEIWEWRNDPWFARMENKSFTYRVNRVKQYIMDNFVFNLDLDTWGLTDKDREMERFSSIMDMEILRQSNALFGYEGDKYYFDIDIRRHFGLDKYTADIIPYWKTETVEAMLAFRHKEGYNTGAGECVSLSSLYAAAMFIVGRIPLEKIFLIATPLHSQSFITERDGILTNNRRIVTKTMWYNGTELSEKARRAIANEKITIVSHVSGYIHFMYPEATIDRQEYDRLETTLRTFLTTEFTFEVFINFLRTKSEFWDCFQYRHLRHNKECYIDLRTIFSYEHSSKNKFASDTRKLLFEEVDARDFAVSPQEGKIIINDFEDYLNRNSQLSFDDKKDYFIRNILSERCSRMKTMLEEMRGFIRIEPRLPSVDKEFRSFPPLQITTEQSREAIISHISEMSSQNEFAELAQYAYRSMANISWEPFVKAAIERNPVCVEGLKGRSLDDIHALLSAMPDESIYKGADRMAMPDEVWNFGRGDGAEKAFVLAAYLYATKPTTPFTIRIANGSAVIETDGKQYSFATAKSVETHLQVDKEGTTYLPKTT
ncbi:MAG: hypothetical protein LBV39_06225 [Bacteroidales bacterium]|jgi:hypothetical protein|nr:hypothetical protein [Bacteroidales bacterium]